MSPTEPSPPEVRFALLGPLVVGLGDTALALPGPRQRAALALLLLQPGRTVPVPRLIDALWGEEPPRTARAQVHNVVSKLRAALPAETAEQLLRHSDGYQLQVAPAQVDAELFAEDLAAARDAHRAGDPARAERLLRSGLGRWRGEPLDGIDLPFAVAARTRLAEQRRSGWELLADVQLERGLEAELIPELTGLLAEHPHWEGLADRLARCLFRAGRQPDALAVVRETRERLAEDFGLDAGAELNALEQALLRGDAALLAPAAPQVPAPRSAAEAPDRARPALLPAPGFGFVGRAAETAELDRLLRTSSGEARIALLTGPAGMGKTALAVRWGQRARADFPDGQLFVDLHGYDAHERVAPARALERFLLALGVPADRIPADPGLREDLYRSTVAPLRLLVVLDNAVDEEQVRPLLPGGVGAATVVTSRNALGGLTADHGARPVELGVLPEADAVAALERIAGAEVVAGAPEAAAALVSFCAGMPLALRISAVRLTHPPRVDVAALAAELEPAHARLAGLRLPGGPHAVSRSLDHSYHALPGAPARLFRALCLFPGASVTVAALGAMTGPGPVGDGMADHARAHPATVEGGARLGTAPAGPARPALPAGQEPADGPVGHVGAPGADSTSGSLAGRLAPGVHARDGRAAGELPVSAGPAEGDAVGPHVVGDAAAALATARDLLAAHLADAVGEVADGGRLTVHDLVRLYGREQAAQLPEEARWLRDGAVGWYVAVAQEAAVQLSPFTLPFEPPLPRPWTGEAPFADRDGALAWFLAEAENMEALIRQAEAEGDPLSVWALAGTLALHLLQRHQLDRLVDIAEAGERAANAQGLTDRAGALANYAGIAYAMLKDLRAADAFDRAIRAAEECGDQLRAMRTSSNLGNFYYERGLYAEAALRQQAAAGMARELGDINAMLGILANLALTRLELGETDDALALTAEAVTVAEELGDTAQAPVYRGQHAFALLYAGRAEESLELSRRCLADAERMDVPLQRARMTDQVGRALAALGRLPEARAAMLEAARLHEEIGSGQAESVRARLAELDAVPA